MNGKNYKKIGYVILLLVMMFALSSCIRNVETDHEGTSEVTQSEVTSTEKGEVPMETQRGAYHRITAEEAKEMMDKEEVIVVDVRTQAEYDQGHVKGAILVPNETIGSEPPELLPDKNATIILYCRSGNRSGQAAEKLLDMGYQTVYDFGSIMTWSYEIER